MCLHHVNFPRHTFTGFSYRKMLLITFFDSIRNDVFSAINLFEARVVHVPANYNPIFAFMMTSFWFGTRHVSTNDFITTSCMSGSSSRTDASGVKKYYKSLRNELKNNKLVNIKRKTKEKKVSLLMAICVLKKSLRRRRFYDIFPDRVT